VLLNEKTREILRTMINEKTGYRSGPKLIEFFKEFGSEDFYGPGFPSRWAYTDKKLAEMNGTSDIDRCILKVFAPINFVEKIQTLDALIDEFNRYLAFDKWSVVRNGADITFKRQDVVKFDRPISEPEETFLRKEFSDVSVRDLGLDGPVEEVLEQRTKEIERCFAGGSSLAVILLAGSTLEGILLGVASQFRHEFCSARTSPKTKDGKVRPLHEWNLNGFIDVARELGLLEHDTSRFSHSLREFRNYIHPFQQLASGFSPKERTAKICLQVLRAAIQDLHGSVVVFRQHREIK
jgi:hypothetical protein